MNHRIMWPLAALLGFAIFVMAISQVPAQPRPGMFNPFVQSGRFVVAHATEKQVIILDTGTGKLYKATSADFQKYSELPKMEMPYPVFPDKDKGPKDLKRPPLPDKDKKTEKDKEKKKNDE